MPFYFFIWTPEIERYLAHHGVTPEEFEEVVQSPERVDTSRSSHREIVFGHTSAGRYLACVYEMLDETSVLPVTAYEPDDD